MCLKIIELYVDFVFQRGSDTAIRWERFYFCIFSQLCILNAFCPCTEIFLRDRISRLGNIWWPDRAQEDPNKLCFQ